jgi:hypothetical protein
MEELQLLANYTIEPTRIMEDRLSSSVFKSKDLIDIYERIAHNQNWKTTD